MSENLDPRGQDVAGVKKQFDDSVELLSAVRSSLADLLREVRAGNAGGLKEIAGKQSELESALKRVFEAEQRYNDWLAKQTGALAPGELDLDAVRYQIGCRLSRLRECCTTE